MSRAQSLGFVRVALLETDVPRTVPKGISRFAAARFRLLAGSRLPPADAAKRWDVANILDLAEALPRNARIVDCGAFNSAPLFTLARQGYKNLHGIDLDPKVVQLSRRGVRCTVQDGQATAFASGSLGLLICASTIEHGMSWGLFLAEARRLLPAGGRLYVSTDVVAPGSQVESLEAFGQPWRPLTPDDIPTTVESIRAAGFDVPAAPRVSLPERLPFEFFGIPLGFVAFGAVAT